MKCPSCSAERPEGAPECEACGVNFAKWQAKVEKAAAEAAAAPPPAPPPPPRSTLGITLSVLAFLCLGTYAAYDFASQRIAPPQEKTGVLVKPEAYRGRIQALEAALYKDAPPTLADAQAVSNEASQLAGAIMERHQKNPFVRDAVGDIMEFAGAVSSAEEGLTMLPTARLDWTRRWEAVRARRFEKAPWFHAAVTAADGPAPDFERAAARIQTAGHRLKTLLASVPPELEAFGDEDVNMPDLQKDPGGAKAKIEAWRAWTAAWEPRVDQALGDFPKPDEIPEELQFAYDTLVRSAQEARNPPNPGPGAFVAGAALSEVYLPGKRLRDTWAANIGNWLDGLGDSIKGARDAKNAPKKG